MNTMVPTVSPEGLILDMNRLSEEWKQHSGKFEGHDVNQLSEADFQELNAIGQHVRLLFQDSQAVDQSKISEHLLLSLHQAQDTLKKISKTVSTLLANPILLKKQKTEPAGPLQLANKERETELAAWIQSGGKAASLEPVYGPVNRSDETVILNEMIKALLVKWDAVKFEMTAETLTAIFQGQTFDFLKILANADFNHLNLYAEEETDKNKFLNPYEKLLGDGPYCFDPAWYTEDCLRFLNVGAQRYFAERDPEGLYQDLTLAEKGAINVYTGLANWFMIRLLKGDINGAVEAFTKYKEPLWGVDSIVKEGLLHCAVCIFALNRLPDYVPRLRPDGSVAKYLYRTETLSDEEIRRRNQLVEDGGKTSIFQFMSTSHTHPQFWMEDANEHGSVKNNGLLLVENAKGKLVEGLSFHPEEREVLLPPTQVQWLYHKEDPNTHMHFYIVRPITSPKEYPVKLPIDFYS